MRKILRSGETAFAYGRTVQPRPKLAPWVSVLDELLVSNAAKSAREQLTLIRLFEELRGRGYDGGYDAVRRYASVRIFAVCPTAASRIPASVAKRDWVNFSAIRKRR